MAGSKFLCHISTPKPVAKDRYQHDKNVAKSQKEPYLLKHRSNRRKVFCGVNLKKLKITLHESAANVGSWMKHWNTCFADVPH